MPEQRPAMTLSFRGASRSLSICANDKLLTSPIPLYQPAPHSGRLAFGLEWQNDGIDTYRRWPRRRRKRFSCFRWLGLACTRAYGSHSGPLCDGAADRKPRNYELAQLERLTEVPDPDLYGRLDRRRAVVSEFARACLSRISRSRDPAALRSRTMPAELLAPGAALPLPMRRGAEAWLSRILARVLGGAAEAGPVGLSPGSPRRLAQCSSLAGALDSVAPDLARVQFPAWDWPA